MKQRIIDRLDEGERDAIWQYTDPIWPAHYAWHPEEGWLYYAKGSTGWAPSSAGHDTVTHYAITSSTNGDKHDFIEIARFRAGGAWLFTPTGVAVPLPDEINTGWESTTEEKLGVGRGMGEAT